MLHSRIPTLESRVGLKKKKSQESLRDPLRWHKVIFSGGRIVDRRPRSRIPWLLTN